MGFRTAWYETTDAIKAYTRDPDYTKTLAPGGLSSQLCMGVIMKAREANNWEYTLMYNSSANPDFYDTINFGRDQNQPFKEEDDEWFQFQLKSGMFYMVNLIDTMILQEATSNPNAQINARFTRAPVKDYRTSELYSELLEGNIAIFMLLPILIIFLRFVYNILYEKEYKIAQNLTNMGMSPLSYYFSWLGWYTCVTLVLSILWTIIIKLEVLTESSFFFIWLLYFVPTMVMISIGFFLTAFFTKAKSGVLAAIITFLVAFSASIVRDNVGQDTVLKNAFFAISPFSGLGKMGAMMLLVQSFYQPFNFQLWSTTVLNFRFDVWLYISIIEFVVFILLGIYFDQVWPKDTGVRKHPLFCFMKRKHNNVQGQVKF